LRSKSLEGGDERREFITGAAGVAAWPVAALAQQGERVRRVGVLMPWSEDDRFTKIALSAFVEGLALLGLERGPQSTD
jgi:putative ABC transport system substrate-binding protein